MKVKGIPDQVDLGVALVPIVWVAEAEMREEATCDPDEPTPDGLWDEERILLHINLARRRRYARQIYLH